MLLSLFPALQLGGDLVAREAGGGRVGEHARDERVKPAAAASASTRVTNARSRLVCSAGGRACGMAETNEPTPRRVSSTPSRSSSP
jgi:hypothetical protein